MCVVFGAWNCINLQPCFLYQRGLAQPNEPIFRLLLKIAVRYPHSQLSQLLEHFGVPFSNETLLKHMEHTQKYVGLVWEWEHSSSSSYSVPVPHSNKQDQGTLMYILHKGKLEHTYLFGHLPLSTRRGWVWWARHCTLLLWPRPTSPTGVARRSYLFKWWDLRKSLPTFLVMNKRA